MKITRRLAAAAAAVAVVAGSALTAAPAMAGTMSTQGAIVCHTVGTYHKPDTNPFHCWVPNSKSPACTGYWTYKKVCD